MQPFTAEYVQLLGELNKNQEWEIERQVVEKCRIAAYVRSKSSAFTTRCKRQVSAKGIDTERYPHPSPQSKRHEELCT
jgi:hypothetical protein